ncbi:MAG TPA: hypothetical protein VHW01_02750 [Polyangiaceae bacterium]|jgi:hypothetical protein|nr:hypothetical protein [Polyangiaceae bacterium]
MATKYDPTVIQRFADRLYEEADRIVNTYAIGGFIIGGIGGGAVGMSAMGAGAFLVPGLFGAAILAGLFAIAGYARGNSMRLQAQTALCQVQIEANSRRA